MKVLVVDRIHPILLDVLRGQNMECVDASKFSDKQVLDELKTTQVLVMRSRFTVDAAFIDRCPLLKIIGRVGSGIEHIDQSYAMLKGIKVLSSPEGNSQAVAEHALGMLLTLFNNIAHANNEVKNGTWVRHINQGTELQGKVVGIIGFGNTGSTFAKVLSGFGVRVLAYDKYLDQHEFQATMNEVYKHSDVVSLHLPLTEETRYLVNQEWIDRFQKPIYFINTSRGQIVKSIDFNASLENGKISGACLDVLEFEDDNLKMPPYTDLPDFALRLIQHPKVIVTPHIAGLTHQSFEKLSTIMAEKILSHIQKEV